MERTPFGAIRSKLTKRHYDSVWPSMRQQLEEQGYTAAMRRQMRNNVERALERQDPDELPDKVLRRTLEVLNEVDADEAARELIQWAMRKR